MSQPLSTAPSTASPAPTRPSSPIASTNVRDSTAQAWAEAVGPEVASVMRQALADPAATWFDRKLKLVLDGIAAGLAPT
ncbi:hypothetical protein ACWDA3_55740 [Nonomuraea rubra]